MKKVHFTAIFVLLALFSCQKSNTDPVPGTGATVYMSLTAGGTRNYETTNNNPPSAPTTYSLVSTNRDTAIGTRSYHVFTNSSTGGSAYYNQSGSDYYSFQSLPSGMGSPIENLYLKSAAALNESWTQNFSVAIPGAGSVPITVVNKIQEKGISYTVNNINYTGVIHVVTTLSSAFIPGTALTTNINTYYAPKVGEIENTTIIDLDFMGIVNHTNTKTILKSVSNL